MSKKVDRYEYVLLDHDSEMDIREDGEFVKFEDYEKLKKALDQAIECAKIELPNEYRTRIQNLDDRFIMFIGSPYLCPELAGYMRK